jgi:predicted DNA-binding transcriptional regulator AlpA
MRGYSLAQLSTGYTAEEKKSRAGGRRLLSFAELKSLKGIPFSRVWVLKLVQAGKFPRPVKPGGGGINAWFEDEVDQYLEKLAAARDDEEDETAAHASGRFMFSSRA